MSSFAEIRANAIYTLAKNAGEAWLERKKPLDLRQQPPENDTFQKKAHQAYIQYLDADSPERQADSLVELSQQLINLSRFKSTRRYLNTLRRTIEPLPDTQKRYYQARGHEKLGWIADYETGYSQSHTHFSRSRRLVEQLPEEERDEDAAALHSTTTHFLGRATLGMARQGMDRDRNLRQAEGYFSHDLNLFQIMRDEGSPRPFNEGFNTGWLAMVYMASNRMDEASEAIKRTEKLFQEGLVETTGSGIMAHAEMLKATFNLKMGAPQTARDHYKEAARIRTEIEPYQMGLAWAQLGISQSYFQERKLSKGLDNLNQAIKIQPVVLLYSMNNGIIA